MQGKSPTHNSVKKLENDCTAAECHHDDTMIQYPMRKYKKLRGTEVRNMDMETHKQ